MRRSTPLLGEGEGAKHWFIVVLECLSAGCVNAQFCARRQAATCMIASAVLALASDVAGARGSRRAAVPSLQRLVFLSKYSIGTYLVSKQGLRAVPGVSGETCDGTPSPRHPSLHHRKLAYAARR